MFTVGQNVIYGQYGVCRVEAVGPLKFLRDRMVKYYTLRPLYGANGTKYYVPVDAASSLDPVMSQEEAIDGLTKLRSMKISINRITKANVLTAHYQDLIASHRLDGYLRLYKEVCHKEMQLREKGKKLGRIDTQFYKLAEQRLSGEFSVILNEPIDLSRSRLHEAACA